MQRMTQTNFGVILTLFAKVIDHLRQSTKEKQQQQQQKQQQQKQQQQKQQKQQQQNSPLLLGRRRSFGSRASKKKKPTLSCGFSLSDLYNLSGLIALPRLITLKQV